MLALKSLENEAIYLLREAIGQLERPALLFSGGKDSIVSWPTCWARPLPRPPTLPLLHIDTGHNFPETLDFRDRFAQQIGAQLLVRHVEQSIQSGRVAEESGPRPSRNAAQTVTLLDAIQDWAWTDCWAALAATKKRPAPKSVFFRTATAAVSGTQKISVPNVGT